VAQLISTCRVAVVARDELLIRRLRDALVRDAVAVLDRAPAVGALTRAADEADAIVLAGCRTALDQRAIIRSATARYPGTPSVLVASLSTTGVRKALDAGAWGVVLERDIEPALAGTVRAVCARQVVVPCDFRREAVRAPLSHREKETLALLATGLTNREIAGRLFLAESTVKTHLASIFGKLGVASRSEAAALATDPDENLGLSVLG
jgi:DNA-binding NarL/FixJ family response regulator